MKKQECLPTRCVIFFLLLLSSATNAQWSVIGGNVSFDGTYPQHYSFARDSSDNFYVAFADKTNQYIITVKKLEPGLTWTNVGTPGFITGSALFYNQGTSIAINPVDQSPYIALADDDHNSKASIMRYDGSAWVYVGSPGFSATSACSIKLAFTPAGVPYVSYNDCSSGEISVMYFTGTWQYAGAANFALGSTPQLTIAPDNTIAIAFRDVTQAEKISVMRLLGNSWTYAGTPGFSDDAAQFIALAADSNGKLYAAYGDYAHNNKITVKSLAGNVWNTVGTPSFSNFEAQYIDINVNRYGEPYVSYADNIFPVAKKFYNGEWKRLGNNNFIVATSCQHTSILNDKHGEPYVLTALTPFQTLPFVYKYSPCADTAYHFEATAVLDSLLSFDGDSTTVTISATGGTAPYTGTGSIKVFAAGYYQFTVTDRSGCSTIVSIDVPAPPCSDNNWTGSYSSDWNDPNNWSCGTVPADITTVHVAAGLTNYPVITSFVICKKVIVETGATVTVGTGGELKVMAAQ